MTRINFKSKDLAVIIRQAEQLEPGEVIQVYHKRGHGHTFGRIVPAGTKPLAGPGLLYGGSYTQTNAEVISEAYEDTKRKEATIMAKKLSYQVLEDSGGGLHLAVFDGDDACIWYASGYEHSPDNLQEDIVALRDGGHPVRDGWESDLPDGYTPQQLYDALTSYEYGWQIIADDAGVYPERMGAAGRTVCWIWT